jgi:hypothetical protein
MALPNTTSGIAALKELTELSRELKYYSDGFKQARKLRATFKEIDALKSQARALNNAVKKTETAVKQTKSLAERVKGVADKAKKVTDNLNKGKFFEVNKNLGAAVNVGMFLGNLAVSFLIINFQGQIQEVELRKQKVQSNLGNIEANLLFKSAARIRTLETRTNQIEKNFKDAQDRLFAESGSAIKNSTDAKKLANDALYETRAGRSKLESLIEAARKFGNDALYEVRKGREILNKQLAENQKVIEAAKKQANDALYEERKNTARQNSLIEQLQQQFKQVIGATGKGVGESINQTVDNIKKEIATVKQQQDKTDSRLSFQEKLADT